MLPSIPFLRLRISLQAEEPITLPPFLGSMLRGAFGHALRRLVCVMGPGQGCAECSLRLACVYTRIFEPPVEGEPPPFLRGIDQAVRPYVFEPLGEGGRLAPGGLCDSISCRRARGLRRAGRGAHGTGRAGDAVRPVPSPGGRRRRAGRHGARGVPGRCAPLRAPGSRRRAGGDSPAAGCGDAAFRDAAAHQDAPPTERPAVVPRSCVQHAPANPGVGPLPRARRGDRLEFQAAARTGGRCTDRRGRSSPGTIGRGSASGRGPR